MSWTKASSFFALLAVLVTARADAPTNYYASAEGKAGGELRDALHAIIRNHRIIPYSGGSLDTSDALKILDADPTNTNNVILLYSTNSVPASTFGNSGWNREHQWPNSYGLDDDEPAYLRACDANVNSSRGNKYYDTSDTNAPSYTNPAHVEAPLCTTDSDSWQPPAFDRGNIARAILYMATRYTGDTNNEPALVLTDNGAIIQSTNTYMGKLSTLLAWHKADPVDAAEQLRNDRVYSLYQTNRNPFVDHPEWVNLTFAPAYTNPPVLNITLTTTGCTLTWLATNQSALLEVSTDLPGDWMTATNTPVLTNGHFAVLCTNTVSRSFFRLKVQ